MLSIKIFTKDVSVWSWLFIFLSKAYEVEYFYL